MSTMAVTLKDVAQAVGCSTAVVSTVLNGARGNTVVSDGLRERIHDAARRLGYRPNFTARSLRGGPSVGIGFVLLGTPHQAVIHGYWGLVVAGAELGAREHDRSIVIISEETPLAAGPRRAVRYLQEGRIGGLIAPGFLAHLCPDLDDDAAGPLVWACNGPAHSPHPRVELDSAPGIEAAVAHLAALGHRDILWVGRQSDGHEALPERRTSYEAAMRAYGLTPRALHIDDSAGLSREIELARDALRPVLAAPRPTALLCANENLASGAYAAAAGHGLRIPDDLSIIGFDDIRAEFLSPPLTVVSHMLIEIGARAAAMALEMEGDPARRQAYRGAVEHIPARLVVRGSTGVAP
jgi:LacI family transcriptional regulator